MQRQAGSAGLPRLQRRRPERPKQVMGRVHVRVCLIAKDFFFLDPGITGQEMEESKLTFFFFFFLDFL